MATQRLPVPGADDDQWGTILNAFLRVLHAENGSIQQWENDSERPTSPDEGETGINLKSGLFEAYQDGQWVALTKDTNCVCPLMVVENIFTDLLNVDITLYTLVLAKGYWSPADWGGGVFIWKADATEAPDGGRYFKSARSETGRWVRKFQDNVNVLHYGAVPDRKFLAGGSGNPLFGGVYGPYGASFTGYFTSKPLSAKFSVLADAKAWYGANVVSSLTNEIDYCAIQATMENNVEVFIPEGAYRCNMPLKMIRKRKLYGAGEQSFIYFHFCSAIVPKQTTPSSDLNFVYQDNFYIGFLHFRGSHDMGKEFDDNISAINFPANRSDPWAYSQSAPSAWLCKIEHVTIEYFAGHGLKCLDQFNCAYDFISVQHCGGHGIYIQGGNTTTLRDCWAGVCGNGYASYRVIGGATLIGCNGNDSPKNYWGSFGGAVTADNGYEAYPNISLIGCNIEGAEKSILIISGAQITFENCFFQAKLTEAEPFFIFDEGYESSIVLINNRAFSIGGDKKTLAVQPVAFIKCTGNAPWGRYIHLGNRTLNPGYEWLHKAVFVDNAGNNIYGTTNYALDIPGIYSAQPTYAVNATTSKSFSAEAMYVGPNNTTAHILSGIGKPENTVSAPVGSLYLRRDGSTGETLYIKENGTGNTGWVAVS